MKKNISKALAIVLLSTSLTSCSNPELTNVSVDSQIENVSSFSNNPDSLDSVFAVIDEDNDSKILFSDLEVYLEEAVAERSNKNILMKNFKEAFSISDTNKNNAIEKNEFKSFSNELPKIYNLDKNVVAPINDVEIVKLVFNSIKDKSDSISEKALINFLSTSKKVTSNEVKTAFKQYDKNNNKLIDSNEFLAIFANPNQQKNGIISDILWLTGTKLNDLKWAFLRVLNIPAQLYRILTRKIKF